MFYKVKTYLGSSRCSSYSNFVSFYSKNSMHWLLELVRIKGVGFDLFLQIVHVPQYVLGFRISLADFDGSVSNWCGVYQWCLNLICQWIRATCQVVIRSAFCWCVARCVRVRVNGFGFEKIPRKSLRYKYGLGGMFCRCCCLCYCTRWVSLFVYSLVWVVLLLLGVDCV